MPAKEDPGSSRPVTLSRRQTARVETPLIRHAAAVVILAGGGSTRMGRDKAMLDVDGVPMIERIVRAVRPMFDEVLVSVAEDGTYAFLDAKTVPDLVPGAGPLGGILSGLEAANHETCLILACDIPEVNRRLVDRLLRYADRHDAVVPRYPDGSIEPVFAVYRKSLLPVMRRVLARGGRKIREIYRDSNVYYLPIDPGDPVVNLNTPDDYQAYVEGSASEAP